MRNPSALLLVLALGCDAPIDDARPDVGSAPCSSHEDCDDEIFCNGLERCVPSSDEADARGCAASARSACLAGQSCDESRRACVTDCAATLDADRDGAAAIECGGRDCDDSDAGRRPGAIEVCDVDHLDEDCDPSTFGVRDGDGDTHPDARCCNETRCGTDCDDVRASVHPGGAELCNETDDDCDLAVDEGAGIACFADGDRDGYAPDGAARSMACGTCPLGSTPRQPIAGSIDCAEGDPAVRPDQPDSDCDGGDDDCDARIDENATMANWRMFYIDSDGDGFGRLGDAGTLVCAATVPGRTLAPGDCDDALAVVYPGAPDVCDRLRNDCTTWASGDASTNAAEDADGDGHAPLDARCAAGLPRDDCADSDPIRTFCDPVMHRVGSAVGRIRAGDLDRDGNVDIVARTETSVLAHYGDGGVSWVEVALWTPTDATSNGLQLVDVEGDGDLDLVVDGPLAVRTNPGARMPSWSGEVVAAGAVFGAGQPAADYDGDGDIDLVAVRSIGAYDELAVFERTATAWSSSGIANESASASTYHAPRPFDLDGNGRLDVLVARDTPSSDDGITWLRSAPDRLGGRWQRERVCTRGAFAPLDFDVGDVDADGDIDIAGPASIGAGDLCRNPGATPPPQWAVEDDRPGALRSQNEEVVLVDLDRDGDLDTLETGGGGVYFLERREAGYVRHEIGRGAESATRIDVADLDRDGDLDVVFSHAGGTDWIEMSGAPFAPR